MTERASTEDSVCPECMGWLEEKEGWLRCMSCQYGRKLMKTIITPIAGPGTSDVDDFNNL